jgi:hypothetical protein
MKLKVGKQYTELLVVVGNVTVRSGDNQDFITLEVGGVDEEGFEDPSWSELSVDEADDLIASLIDARERVFGPKNGGYNPEEVELGEEEEYEKGHEDEIEDEVEST